MVIHGPVLRDVYAIIRDVETKVFSIIKSKW